MKCGLGTGCWLKESCRRYDDGHDNFLYMLWFWFYTVSNMHVHASAIAYIEIHVKAVLLSSGREYSEMRE